MAQKVTLIRGWSGAGKTTKALEIIAHEPGTILVEADQYFVRPDGQYRFEPSEIKMAHLWAQLQLRKALLDGYNVVVANTFTRPFEAKHYLKMARDFDAKIEIIEVRGDFTNVHNVPESVIQEQKQRFVSLEQFKRCLGL